MKFAVSAALCAVLVLAAPAAAEEGMWQLDTFDASLYAKMQGLGLELTQEQLYAPGGKGIAYAIVNLGGGTGSFVSPYGLILTNHHVAFGAIQRASGEGRNYIEDGFYADRPENEVKAEGYEARVLVSITDVSDRVLKAAKGKTGAKRFNAIEDAIKKITQEAEEGTDNRVAIASFYEGMQYKMFTYFVIKDVRLVYAPPRSIGNYGGDIDNWMWPRHTGDFSFLRAYVAPDGRSADYSEENVPYEPAVHLAMSAGGVSEGDFMMILGFPGQTQRYRSSYAVDWAQNWRFPERIRMFRDLLGIFAKASEGNEAVAIKTAQFDAMLNNSMKNYEGQLEGFRKAGLLERKIAEEKEFTAWVNADAKRAKKYGGALARIEDLYEGQENIRDKQAILQLAGFLNQMTSAAGTIYRWSEEKTKQDLDRDPVYMERNIPRIRMRLGMIDRSFDEGVDRQVLAYFLHLSQKLPEGQRIKAIDEMLAAVPGEKPCDRIDALVERLYAGTKLAGADERARMFDLSREDLMKEGDSFVDFYAGLYPEIKKLEDIDEAFGGDISAVRPVLIEGIREWRGGAFYPDANGTMRLTFGTVKGYVPRDAISYDPMTVLGGAIEKNTGIDPFDCPPKLVDLWKTRDFGKYLDEDLGDVPIAFLGTCDITGGNSGSPVLNSRGECIGAAFDGNWESVSSDWLFNEDLTRTISVESRYILFVLDKFSGAYELLGELTIR
ncbi:MAG: S46 family peptidase [Candidatus Krumholzibacteria bacterium]|nr:S46 family peptidase [Candidatus Krumholzibacteria bacterium]